MSKWLALTLIDVFLYKYCEAVIPSEDVEPNVRVLHKRVEFVGSSKNSNISILLWNITFEDEGDYICFARNPKEKNRNHSAVFTLIVVDQSKLCSFSLQTWVYVQKNPREEKYKIKCKDTFGSKIGHTQN